MFKNLKNTLINEDFIECINGYQVVHSIFKLWHQVNNIFKKNRALLFYTFNE